MAPRRRIILAGSHAASRVARNASATSLDVVRLAGVSQSAVSRTFSSGSISAAARDKLLAGFDGTKEAARAAYRLSTIRQPLAGMVDVAIDLLAMSATDSPVLRVIPAYLVQRESTSPLPGRPNGTYQRSDKLICLIPQFVIPAKAGKWSKV